MAVELVADVCGDLRVGEFEDEDGHEEEEKNEEEDSVDFILVAVRSCWISLDC